MLRTNPDIKAASYNRLAKDQEVLQAKSGYYPSIGVSSGTGVTNQSHPYYKLYYIIFIISFHNIKLKD
jgi:adhesin transport system outer membrane protein